MSIRISFPTTEPAVELQSHALTELYLSLTLLSDSGRNAALAPFVRRMRARLPRPVRKEISALSFMLGPPFPAECLFPENGGKAVRAGGRADGEGRAEHSVVLEAESADLQERDSRDEKQSQQRRVYLERRGMEVEVGR